MRKINAVFKYTLSLFLILFYLNLKLHVANVSTLKKVSKIYAETNSIDASQLMLTKNSSCSLKLMVTHLRRNCADFVILRQHNYDGHDSYVMHEIIENHLHQFLNRLADAYI
jgi:hypothetical protein